MKICEPGFFKQRRVAIKKASVPGDLSDTLPTA